MRSLAILACLLASGTTEAQTTTHYYYQPPNLFAPPGYRYQQPGPSFSVTNGPNGGYTTYYEYQPPNLFAPRGAYQKRGPISSFTFGDDPD